jgi:hypothetical protein
MFKHPRKGGLIGRRRARLQIVHLDALIYQVIKYKKCPAAYDMRLI